MIGNLFNLLKKDIRILLRHRGAILASMCLPFLLYIFFSVAFSDMMKREADISPIRVAVVDNEKSTVSRMLIKSFMDNKSFSNMVKAEVTSYEEARELFNQGKLTAILEIPDGFSRSLIYLENYPIKVTLNNNEPLKASVMKNMMESYGGYVSTVEKSVVALYRYLDDGTMSDEKLKEVNDEISLKLIFTALSRSNIFEEGAVDNIPSSSSKEYFILSIIVLLIMYNGVTAGNHIIREMKSGCAGRIFTSPSTIMLYVISKVLSFSLYSFVQSLIFILPLAFISGLNKMFFLVNIFIYMAAAIFFIVSIFVFLSSFFNNEEAFVIAGNIYVFIAAVIGGCFLPLQLLPQAIVKMASFTPNFWIIKGALHIISYRPLEAVGLNILSFIVVGILLNFAAQISLKRTVS